MAATSTSFYESIRSIVVECGIERTKLIHERHHEPIIQTTLVNATRDLRVSPPQKERRAPRGSARPPPPPPNRTTSAKTSTRTKPIPVNSATHFDSSRKHKPTSMLPPPAKEDPTSVIIASVAPTLGALGSSSRVAFQASLLATGGALALIETSNDSILLELDTRLWAAFAARVVAHVGYTEWVVSTALEAAACRDWLAEADLLRATLRSSNVSLDTSSKQDLQVHALASLSVAEAFTLRQDQREAAVFDAHLVRALTTWSDEVLGTEKAPRGTFEYCLMASSAIRKAKEIWSQNKSSRGGREALESVTVALRDAVLDSKLVTSEAGVACFVAAIVSWTFGLQFRKDELGSVRSSLMVQFLSKREEASASEEVAPVWGSGVVACAAAMSHVWSNVTSSLGRISLARAFDAPVADPSGDFFAPALKEPDPHARLRLARVARSLASVALVLRGEEEVSGDGSSARIDGDARVVSLARKWALEAKEKHATSPVLAGIELIRRLLGYLGNASRLRADPAPPPPTEPRARVRAIQTRRSTSSHSSDKADEEDETGSSSESSSNGTPHGDFASSTRAAAGPALPAESAPALEIDTSGLSLPFVFDEDLPPRRFDDWSDSSSSSWTSSVHPGSFDERVADGRNSVATYRELMTLHPDDVERLALEVRLPYRKLRDDDDEDVDDEDDSYQDDEEEEEEDDEE